MAVHDNCHKAPKKAPDVLLYIALLSLAGHVLSALLSLSVGQLVFGLLLVAYVPGALLVRILFERVEGMGGFERGVLSVGSSVIVGVWIGLLLNLVPDGLRADTALVIFWGMTAALLLIGSRSRQYPSDDATPASLQIPHFLRRLKEAHSPGTLVAYAVASFAAAMSLILLLAIALRVDNGEQFTEFYVLANDGQADPGLLELSTRQHNHMVLGISNRTQAATTYYVEGVLREGVIYRSDSIHLQDGESRIVTLSLQLPPDAVGASVVFRLYTNGQPQAENVLYLRVRD